MKKIIITLPKRTALYDGVRKTTIRPAQIHPKKKGKGSYDRKREKYN